MRGSTVLRSSVWSVALLTLGCIEDPEAIPVEAVKVGALLPFSGDLAASGINLERPLIMAAEAINEHGGIDQRDVVVLAVDSNRYFPNPEEGFEEHQTRLRAFLRGDTSDPLVADDNRIVAGAGIDALIGPLVPELGVRLAAEARRNQVVHMTATVTSESNVAGKCSFSLFPSFRVLGRALGNRMRADGVSTAGILYLSDDYNTKLFGQLELAFSDAGGTVNGKSPTTTGKESYVADIDNVLVNDPDALVLLAPPRLASQIAIQALASSRASPRLNAGSPNPLRWYFAPLLRVEDFPNNVPPGLVEGGVGVAPGVDQGLSSSFAERFRERWDAEPTLDAQYLFDAMSVLLLALKATSLAHPGVNLTSMDSFSSTCQNVESMTTGGASVPFEEALSGAIYERASQDLDYAGLSGPVEVDGRGNARAGLVEIWRVPTDTAASIETISVRSVEEILRP